MAPINQYLVAD